MRAGTAKIGEAVGTNDSIARRFVFTLTYMVGGNSGERTVEVEAVRTETDVRLNVKVGSSSKSKKMRPHKRMPADRTLVKEAVQMAKQMIPKGASQLETKNKRG